jgi:hypothetical protein
MIPKIIHFCWFGGNDLPNDTKRYIRTWRKILKGYKIHQWNEKNFDLSTAPEYVKEAYRLKKYAFVSDYVRIYALKKYGGVYLDTDVEIIRDFSNYLEDSDLVLGFESNRLLTTAFIASVPGHPLIETFEKFYWKNHFIMEDGSCDLTPINDRISELAVEWGLDLDLDAYQELKDNIKVYPRDYFAAFDIYNWHTKVTENTCAIHHMAASWVGPKKKVRFMIIKTIHFVIGEKNYDNIRNLIKKRKLKEKVIK